MTDRRRNLAILGIVVVLLAGALAVIVTKPTKLGLDLRGGIELVYEGKPTPKVPEVTPQAIDDSIETIRKRTDALGVSEPEIQRAGANQISIGLPDVQNADRAVEQVGTTAQLQFYDWEDERPRQPRARTRRSRAPTPSTRRPSSRPPRSRGPRPPTSRRPARRAIRARTGTPRTTPRTRSSTSSAPTSS